MSIFMKQLQFGLANPFSAGRVTILQTKSLYLFTEMINTLIGRQMCAVLGTDVSADSCHLGGYWYLTYPPRW